MAITFKEIEAIDNGAQFYNADLHVHSFGASHDVKDTTMTVEALIDEAVRIEIHILAITDHNNDANIEKAIQYAQKYAGRLLFLPGVEITTANGHVLVYFAPTQFEKVRNLLAKINIEGKLGDQNSHTAMSMAGVIKEAELLGGICIAAHIDRKSNGFEMLASGYPNWKKDIMMSPGLYALEVDDASHLVWYSESDDPTAEGSERKKIIRSRAASPSTIGRPVLAHVQGSDAHSLSGFSAARSGKTLTRFKLNELSYDAFRTALADPDARVRALATIPPSLPRILGMQITDGFLDGETYHFSDNLNCFIGGRGTGKSSALQNLAFGLGLDDNMEEHDNCPGTVIVYCEGVDGIRYRYERVRGSKPIVKAKDEGAIVDVPLDAFRVEYYQQGELAEVAKNPLKNPTLLQQFLDRHLSLADLQDRESALVQILLQNSVQLIPLETASNQIPEKTKSLAEVNKKIEIAEAGKLKEIATAKNQVGNEKNLASAIQGIQTSQKLGLSLSKFRQEYATFEANAGVLTGSLESKEALRKIKKTLDTTNLFLEAKEKEINDQLKSSAVELGAALSELKVVHSQLDQLLNVKITELQKKGLTGDIAELTALINQKSVLAKEIGNITGQNSQLSQTRKDRQTYLKELSLVREQIMERRKAQLNSINTNLSSTIQDYIVFVHYEPAGIIDAFKEFILSKMQGTYLQEQVAEQLCSRIAPADLADWVLSQNVNEIHKASGIGIEWATKLCEKLRYYTHLHALEVMWKAPCPIITVRTKGANPKDIPVNQLSDGQKHTIMLTIAMLAESNIPLVIDQPEDDLDNAFIFSTVVKTLRSIKERRQVILVTHNANIAVLGDAELLLPMRRSGDGGVAFDRGSIDKTETKQAAMNILEGGDIAFQRRREIYGY